MHYAQSPNSINSRLDCPRHRDAQKWFIFILPLKVFLGCSQKLRDYLERKTFHVLSLSLRCNLTHYNYKSLPDTNILYWYSVHVISCCMSPTQSYGKSHYHGQDLAEPTSILSMSHPGLTELSVAPISIWYHGWLDPQKGDLFQPFDHRPIINTIFSVSLCHPQNFFFCVTTYSLYICFISIT